MKFIFALFFLCSFSLNAQNSFKNGVEHFKNENFTEALLDFKKVSKDEDKYWEAQEYIGDLYAKQVIEPPTSNAFL